MSYKSEESKVYQGLNSLRKEFCAFRSEHNVSEEHLQAYIDEACFRWNTRKASQVERLLDMFFMSIGLVRPNREFVLCKDV